MRVITRDLVIGLLEGYSNKIKIIGGLAHTFLFSLFNYVNKGLRIALSASGPGNYILLYKMAIMKFLIYGNMFLMLYHWYYSYHTLAGNEIDEIDFLRLVVILISVWFLMEYAVWLEVF